MGTPTSEVIDFAVVYALDGHKLCLDIYLSRLLKAGSALIYRIGYSKNSAHVTVEGNEG
jgi:hypothetical protein